MKPLEKILTIAGGLIGLLFGSNQEIIRILSALLIIMGFDIFTGISKAIMFKTVKSKKLNIGVMKKILMLVSVSFCYFLDTYKILNVGVSLESAAIMMFLIGECVSIVENFIELGIPVPKILKQYLDKAAQDQAAQQQAEEALTSGK